MKSIRLFISLLIIYLFGGLGTLKLMAQSNSAQNLHDTLYEKISYHLERLESDSALAVTDIIYNLYSEKEDIYEIVRVKVRRAEILRSVVSLDLALDNLLEVQKMVESLEPSDLKSYYYNRLAAVQYERKNANEAITAVRESQRIDSLKNNKDRVLSNLNILGSIYRDRKDWEKSLAILSKTYQKAKEDNDTSEMYLAILNLGIAQYRKGDYRDAINSAKIYENHNITSLEVQSVSDNYRIMSQSYWNLGVLDSAYNYLDSAHRHTLDKMQEIVEKRTGGYRISNELDKQRLENSILVAEKEISSSQIFFLAVTLIFLILLAIIFYREKQDYKKLHAEKNDLYLALEKSLLFKNKLIGIVAHDIRNPMSSLTGVIQLYNEGLVNNADLKGMMSKLEASAVSVNFLLENLLNWVLNQKEKLIPKIETFNLSQLVEKTVLEVESQSRAKALNVKLQGFSAELEIISDKSMLGLVIRNILSNAIKFSNQNAEVIVAYQKSIEHHEIVIKDFGVGMSSKSLAQLSAGAKVDSSLGTYNETGTGLGIDLSKEFINVMKGTLNFRSELGKGTDVIILIKVEA